LLAESIILSALFGCVITPTAATNKKAISNTDNCQLMTSGQQCLNGTANWSAAKEGQVLPHFKHIVSGIDAAVPYCCCIFIPLRLVGQ
jgi:hypothetical protein